MRDEISKITYLNSLNIIKKFMTKAVKTFITQSTNSFELPTANSRGPTAN